MRCLGTGSGVSGSVKCDRADVFVMSDNGVELRVKRGADGGTTLVTFKGDPDLLIDLAHQFIAAAQSIKERKKISKRVRKQLK